MKIEKFTSIFSNLEFRHVLFNGSPLPGKITKQMIVEILFRPENQRYIPSFVAYLHHASIHKETCQRLKASILGRLLTQSWAEQLVYDRFPEWECPLSQLEEKAEKIASNNFEIGIRLRRELEQRASLDPAFSTLTRPDPQQVCVRQVFGRQPPYDYNRIIAGDPSVCLNASLVHTDQQKFILAGCPIMVSQVRELFMHLLESKPSFRVWASVLASPEKPEFCNNFWIPDFIRKLPLRNGWRLLDAFSILLAEGASFSSRGTKTFLTKTTLLFSNEFEKKTIFHLHYDGWFDKCVCPDDGLFLLLLEEMERLNTQPDGVDSSAVPIVINCVSGVGRTGMTVLGYWLRKIVRETPKEKLDALTVNIPHMIYSLRKQRAKLLEKPEYVAKLYSIMGRYYQLLR